MGVGFGMVQYHTYSKGVDLASPGILDTSDDAVLHMVRDLSQVSVLSVYFYDELGEVVACSFRQPITEKRNKSWQ